MEVRGLSATAIKDFLLCELKLVFRYDRGIPSLKNDNARLGIAVHEAFEQFIHRMKVKKSFPDPSDYEFALTVFMNQATQEGLQSLSFYKEGRKMVTNFIDKFDPNEDVLEVEHMFKITTPEGVPIVGAIDKVVRINDDTIAIVDYKTGRNALTPYELEEDVQLAMYDLAASIIWPEYKNRILILDYVRIEKSISTYKTDEDRLMFRDFLKSIWLKVNAMSEREIKGRVNKLCGWCDYSTYCPAWAAVVGSDKLTLEPLTSLSDNDFIAHWEKISDYKSILESRQRELKMVAHEKFMLGQSIAANGKELASTQQARTTYDIDKVVGLMPRDDLFSVLTVNKSRLDSYAKDDPELRNRLARVAQVSYNAPVYRVRNVKGEDDGFEQLVEDESAA